MKLIFKQRIFSWFDSYDIYDEGGATLFTVKGQLSWGHCFKVFDARGEEIGMVKQRLFTFLPQFEIYRGDTCVGCIRKEFSFFRPRFTIDYKGWQVEGNFFEWDYRILSAAGTPVATVEKDVFQWADTYVIDVPHTDDALDALMLVLAIDAEKCSRD